MFLHTTKALPPCLQTCWRTSNTSLSGQDAFLPHLPRLSHICTPPQVFCHFMEAVLGYPVFVSKQWFYYKVQVHHGVSHVELQTGRRRGGADPVDWRKRGFNPDIITLKDQKISSSRAKCPSNMKKDLYLRWASPWLVRIREKLQLLKVPLKTAG